MKYLCLFIFIKSGYYTAGIKSFNIAEALSPTTTYLLFPYATLRGLVKTVPRPVQEVPSVLVAIVLVEEPTATK